MPPADLPADMPPFSADLVESGEILAYLHLTGYHAASLTETSSKLASERSPASGSRTRSS